MKLFLLLALFSVIFCFTISRDREAQWQEFKLKYGKEYRSSAEELKRYSKLYNLLELNRMCTHQTKIKRNGKITDFDATWAG